MKLVDAEGPEGVGRVGIGVGSASKQLASMSSLLRWGRTDNHVLKMQRWLRKTKVDYLTT